ncbi:hypothetical protein [Trueperella bialowiezensis]|uniref:Uncharacterized protein n=1 Tax=Trueperella bialowiezensis TaxID=312285 RepID=A0A448PEX6_9ACTO|nr:hypothetical protein [Trueperella bialowiezensis]VEI13489.1 Uncharacterised protein [Trueperella bialowiezensis]
MSNDWLPDHEEKSSRSSTKRWPLYFFLGSATLLFLVVIFIFYSYVIGQGRSLGESGDDRGTEPTAQATIPAPAEPTPEPEPEPEPEPTPARPAPEGAIEAASFTTPAQNIHCHITDSNVECSIYVYDYPSPGQCEGITATYSVGAEGAVNADCQHFVKTSEVYDYGTAIAKNGFACTLERNAGITCWSEMSGHGFNLTRADDTIF